MRPVGPDELSARPPRWKLILLGTLAGGSFLGAFFVRPHPQDPGYHRFADTRTVFGIPNFWNVVSNLPFLVAGLLGLYNALRKPAGVFLAPWLRAPWVVLTTAVFFTAFGSSYYHWAPDTPRLFWDRLPMTLGFGAVLGIVVSERVDLDFGRRAWLPLILLSAASLIYDRTASDLRFYGLLQGWAIVLVPVMLLLFPAKQPGTHHWFLMLALYGIAKVFELADGAVYGIAFGLSGHTLKHLFAGLALGIIYWHLRARRPIIPA